MRLIVINSNLFFRSFLPIITEFCSATNLSLSLIRVWFSLQKDCWYQGVDSNHRDHIISVAY